MLKIFKKENGDFLLTRAEDIEYVNENEKQDIESSFFLNINFNVKKKVDFLSRHYEFRKEECKEIHMGQLINLSLFDKNKKTNFLYKFYNGVGKLSKEKTLSGLYAKLIIMDLTKNKNFMAVIDEIEKNKK